MLSRKVYNIPQNTKNQPAGWFLGEAAKIIDSAENI